MIARKDIRIQEHVNKPQHIKKQTKDIFIVNNNAASKEILLKQQRENVTNEKTSNNNLKQQEKETFKNLIPEISKMQIDADCFYLKNPIKEKGNNNLNPKNNQFGDNQKLNEYKMEIVEEEKEGSEKKKQENSKNQKNLKQNSSQLPNIAKLEKEVEEKKTHKDKLNEILINNYGPEIYEFSMELEKLSFCPNNLKKHKIESEIRTKMIDWMIEVLSAYNSDPQTFSLAVQILDMYMAKTQNVLTNNDIHLLGICSMYIASKMEDIVPLRMNHVKSKISHNKFSEKEIKKKEKVILETINFETINTSTYEFIRTFIFDFIHNNRLQIYKLDMFHHIDVFDNVSIFLSKLIVHSDEFLNYQ